MGAVLARVGMRSEGGRVFFSAFTDRFIFGHILGPFFFTQKWNIHHAMKTEKAKIVIFFRSVDFADWFVGLKGYSKFAPKPF